MLFAESKILTSDPKSIETVILGGTETTVEEFVAVARYNAVVEFSDEYKERVTKSRNLVDKFLAENRRIYGLTTGFGENVRYVISPEDAETLQKNIVRSHACSVGAPLDRELVRAIQFMMLLNTGKGYSGISLEVLELIKDLLNNSVTPYAPGEGSVGYLAVEAQIALVLMGEGKAWYKGELLSGDEALRRAGLKPVSLKCKEGLSLLNGTTSVTGLAILAVYDAVNAAKVLDITGAITFEALKATVKSCDPRVHSMKKHVEQHRTAETILKILEGSEIAAKFIDSKVQDAYVLRCTPQMQGAAKRILRESLDAVYEEMCSVSDNPIIFPEGDDGEGLMGGNFDGSYVGSHADCACIAMATLAKLSERRTERMVNRHLSELPAFLVKNPGLNNGYMIPQYTAAGLVGEIRVLSTPSTIDSVPTCASQEDPVTLAYFASLKAYQVARKLQYIIAIELMVAVQALDFLKPLKPSRVTSRVYDIIREKVAPVEEDRHFHPDMEYIYELVREGVILKEVEEMTGTLDF